MKLIPVLVALFPLCCWSQIGSSHEVKRAGKVHKQKPNIVLIISDDAGYADFGFHGSDQMKTPHLDSIAKNGIRCTQGYVTAAVCSPSRAGLITGRYQQRFGHELNIPAAYSETNGLPLEEETLPTLLKANGYRTIGLGKWHLGYADHFHPLSRGFDDFYGFLQGARSFWPMEEPTRLNRLLRDREPVPEKFEYMTDELGEAASKYIDENKDRPFFMYVAYNAVHTPMHATETDLAEVGVNAGPKRKKLIAMTHALDRSVGKILNSLDRNQLTENTIVVFINDNGGATNNASTNGKLRGTKGTPFEGGLRVPFLVQWPARLDKSVTYDLPVTTLDLLPTFLAACDHDKETKKPLDGVDLLPFLTGEQKGRPHETLYWRRGDNWAIRDGDMKLVTYKDDVEMLFDLASDFEESTNLAKDQPETVSRLKQKFEAWNKEMVAPKWRYQSRRSRNQKDKK